MSETLHPTPRAAVPVLWAGLAATALVTAYAWLDAATTRVLAGHVAASYPALGAAEVDAAVAAYLAILTSIGALGALTWVVVARAARRGHARSVHRGSAARWRSVALRSQAGCGRCPPVRNCTHWTAESARWSY